MKRNYFCGATATAAFALASLPIVACAQTPAPIPPAPVVPRTIPFGDEVAGRRLFFAARDAYQNAPAVSFTANWTATATGAPGAKPTVYTGTESVQLETGKRRLLVNSETVVPGNRNVRRIISNGESVLATRFDQKDGAAQATREFVRLPLDSDTPLYRALLQVQASASSRASTLLFVPNIAPRNMDSLWRSGTIQLNGVAGEVVSEVEAANGQRNDARRMRRYVFDARIPHRLLRFEQWTIQQTPPRPARKNIPADDGVRTTYRREDYANVSLAAQTFPAATFAQALPPDYKEAPLPSVNLPAQTDPSKISPQAVAWLKRWRNAHERFLTVSAEIDVTQKAVQRAPNARTLPPQFANAGQHYSVVYRKPGKTRVTLSGVTGGDPRDPRALVAASNGEQARVSVDGGRNRRAGRTVDVRDPNNAWGALNQAGFNDRYQTLVYVYVGPPAPDNFDSVEYGGQQTTLDGAKADVLTFSRTIDNGRGRRDQGSTTIITMKVWLGADGLPRQMENRRVTNVSGALERDQPPTLTILTRFRSLRVDTEPSVSAFVLPAS